MKPHKRRPPALDPPTARIVRLGFSRDAREFFDKLSSKVQAGLRRKLHDFGKNPAIGKPLRGELQGYHRVTYGRVRSIAEAVVRMTDPTTLVVVLHIGLRKAGSSDDPYEAAAIKAIQGGDEDAIAMMEALVQQSLGGGLPEEEDGPNEPLISE